MAKVYLTGIEHAAAFFRQLRNPDDRHRLHRDGAQLVGRQHPEVIGSQVLDGGGSDASERDVFERRELGRSQTGDDHAQRHGVRRLPGLGNFDLGLE